jgi:two-component SAPR family response regulator
MKKLFLSFVFSFTLLFTVIAQENILILVHPTEYNLELFAYLIENKIIEIDSIKIIGVYHEKETYDYSKSESFIAENNYTNIKLIEIKEPLTPDRLFQNNNCTVTFTN